jgi:hypothetical protein
VTNVDLYDKSVADQNDDQTAPTASSGSVFFRESGGGLTTGAKIITAFGCLAVVALLFASCWIVVAWRRAGERYKQKQHDDERSLRTDWGSLPTDDDSFLRPDFYDLALRHSKLDVHKCHSALCTVCKPNLGVVNMVSVARPGDRWNGPVPHVLSSDLAPEAYGLGGGDDMDYLGFPIKEIESLRIDEESMDEDTYSESYMMHNRSAVSAYIDTDMTHNRSAGSALSLNRSPNSQGSLFHDTDMGFNFVRVANPRQSKQWENYSINAVTL